MPARVTRAKRRSLKKTRRRASPSKKVDRRGKPKKPKKVRAKAKRPAVKKKKVQRRTPTRAPRRARGRVRPRAKRPLRRPAPKRPRAKPRRAPVRPLKKKKAIFQSRAAPKPVKVATKAAALVKTPDKPAKGPEGIKPGRKSLRPPPPLKQYKFIGVPSFTGPKPVRATIPPPPPPPPRPVPATVEERVVRLQERLVKQSEEFRRRYQENLDMSWVYHDSALEGTVYSFQELRTAIDPQATVIQDSSLQPICEEIRRHKAAIEFVRDGAKKKIPITLEVIKRIYFILHPEEGDIKVVKYRKDIPQHRLYFHDYAPPDKIAYKVRQIVDWINDPETKRGRNTLRIAARAHYDLLRVFPFSQDSGKVARLLMNLLMMRAGYEPAIIHSTERQRYYEALKGSAAIILHMVHEAEENGLASIEKMLDEHETNTRSFVS